MQFAIGEDGKRVNANNAKKGVKYFCPMCRRGVTFRNCTLKMKHFAHTPDDPCIDSWHHDMSEWHYTMQEYFDEQYREVVVEKDGIVHRADVLMNGVVIEFQHSPLSPEEFKARNDFYTSCGYRVVWVIDVHSSYVKGDFYSCGTTIYEGVDGYRWLHHKKWLDGKYSKDVSVYLTWDEIGGPVRVFKSKDAEDSYAYFGYPLLYANGVTMKKGMNSLELSKSNIKEETNTKAVVEKDEDYKLKFMYVPGQPREHYICPRTGKFGVTVMGGANIYCCATCRYCSYIDNSDAKTADGSPYPHKMYASHCHYPKEVRSVINDGHPNECVSLRFNEKCCVVESLSCHDAVRESKVTGRAEFVTSYLHPPGFNIKKLYVRGCPPKDYTCPRTGKFGLSLAPDSNHKYGCEYCRYCGDIKHYSEGTSVFCYYPRVVRAVTREGSDWECEEFDRKKHLYKG